MQYPAQKTFDATTVVLQFLDGAEQRFRDSSSALRRWVVRLDLLSDDEARRIEDFFASQEGRYGVFSFADPWNGMVYANCSVEGDAIQFNWTDEGRVATSLTIRQNRS